MVFGVPKVKITSIIHIFPHHPLTRYYLHKCFYLGHPPPTHPIKNFSLSKQHLFHLNVRLPLGGLSSPQNAPSTFLKFIQFRSLELATCPARRSVLASGKRKVESGGATSAPCDLWGWDVALMSSVGDNGDIEPEAPPFTIKPGDGRIRYLLLPAFSL